MIRALWALAVLVLVGAASGVAAQSPASLVADEIVVTPEGRLVASGNVEIFFDGTKVSAAAVVYDQVADRLTLDGPLIVVTADGVIFQATQASLDPRVENGILLGARLVLNRQLQLSAERIDRVDGRYSQLRGVAATSCQVCSGRDPLWEIRARSVIHDEEARLLYFEDAEFRIGGVPVLWMPRLRMPDPSLDRATGLLTPSIRSTNQLGIGLRLPYFIRLGDARDLTLTPFISTETTTLGLRYRQAFDTGALQITGAITQDTLIPDETRGYLTATGAFALPRNYRLTFDLDAVTDRAYLLDYGLSDTDVLESEIAVIRVRDNDYLRGALTVFESLREGDDNDLLPSVVGELQYERRVVPPVLGGTLTFATGFDSLLRRDSTDGTGRDMTRAGATLDWNRTWISNIGLVTEAQGHLGVDVFSVSQDTSFEDFSARTLAGGSVTLRLPLVATGSAGSTHIVEPVAHIAWSQTDGSDVPNEDSTVAEFDEGNLLSLSRFAGEDRIETGLRGAVGLTWTRLGAAGNRSTLTFGRIFREEDVADFSDSSGLRGARSDWLISGQVDFAQGLSLGVRTLLDDQATFTKTEARLDWASDRFAIAAAYVFLPSDVDEDRTDAVSEWTFDGSYKVNDAWTISGEARYDLVADQPAKAGLGVTWRNECVEVGLSVSRRFTSSANVDPTTDLGLSVELLGFSAAGARAGPSRACNG